MSLFLHRAGLMNAFDPLTVAFAEESGATDLGKIDRLIRYVRSQSLLNNFRLYPLKGPQNAGTGPTAYGIGLLTSNNMTLVNGPTWGAGGIAFASASSQYGTIADFLGSETLTVIVRLTHDTSTPSAVETIYSQADLADVAPRSTWLNFIGNATGDPYRLSRPSNASVYAKDTAGSIATASDICLVSQFIDGGDLAFWTNKTTRPLTTVAGTPNTSARNSTASIGFMCFSPDSGGAAYANGTAHALAFLIGTVTTAQRETITDLINAL